jgi:hypothetical protein
MELRDSVLDNDAPCWSLGTLQGQFQCILYTDYVTTDI